MKINPKKLFNTTIFILFTLFTCLFIASNTGYYEYQSKEKVKLTDEKIKEFENDLKSGKKVDLKNYLTDERKNYDNKITKFGNTLSNIIDYEMMDTLEKTFKFFEKLIE